MDYENRIGSKKGSGGVASQQEQNIQTKKRLNKLFDISNDPYIFKNHLGQLECKLCLTIHSSNESYMNHINGRKHQTNLQKRSLLEKDRSLNNQTSSNLVNNDTNLDRNDKSQGIPSYKIQKIRKLETNQFGLFVSIKYPKSQFKEADKNSIFEPQFRFMSTFEYQKDAKKDGDFQYLIFQFENFENIGLKIPSLNIDLDSIWSFWDEDLREFYFQFLYQAEEDIQAEE